MIWYYSYFIDNHDERQHKISKNSQDVAIICFDLPSCAGLEDVTENTRKGVAVRYLSRAKTT